VVCVASLNAFMYPKTIRGSFRINSSPSLHGNSKALHDQTVCSEDNHEITSNQAESKIGSSLPSKHAHSGSGLSSIDKWGSFSVARLFVPFDKKGGVPEPRLTSTNKRNHSILIPKGWIFWLRRERMSRGFEKKLPASILARNKKNWNPARCAFTLSLYLKAGRCMWHTCRDYLTTWMLEKDCGKIKSWRTHLEKSWNRRRYVLWTVMHIYQRKISVR